MYLLLLYVSVSILFFLLLFRLQRYTFFLKQQNQLSEPTVMVPMNIDGDTHPIDIAVVLVGFLLVGERVETQAVLAASTMA